MISVSFFENSQSPIPFSPIPLTSSSSHPLPIPRLKYLTSNSFTDSAIKFKHCWVSNSAPSVITNTLVFNCDFFPISLICSRAGLRFVPSISALNCSILLIAVSVFRSLIGTKDPNIGSYSLPKLIISKLLLVSGSERIKYNKDSFATLIRPPLMLPLLSMQKTKFPWKFSIFCDRAEKSVFIFSLGEKEYQNA